MKKLNAEYIRSVSRKFNYSEINSKAAELSFYLLLSSIATSVVVYILTFLWPSDDITSYCIYSYFKIKCVRYMTSSKCYPAIY